MATIDGAAARPTHRLWNRGFTLACFAFLVAMIGTTLLTPLYPIYQQQYAISELMVTVIYGVYAAGTIAALIIAGNWSDQIGRRPIVFASLMFSAATAIIFAFDANLPSLLFARILSGMSAGLATGAATVMVIELAPPERRATATLLATAVNMGGLGLGPLIGGLFAAYIRWPTHFVFVVDIGLIVLAALGLLKIPETVKTAPHSKLRPQSLALPQEVRGVFIPAAIAGIAGFAVLGLFSAVTPAFMGKILGLHNLALTGLVVFIVFAASTVGQILLGLLPKNLAMPLGCVLLAAGALVVATSIIVESLAVLIVGAILAGFGQGLGFRAGLAAVATASPADQRGGVTSTFFVVLYIAISVPVIGVGLWANALGLRSAGTGFAIIVAALSLLALAALLIYRRSRHMAQRHLALH